MKVKETTTEEVTREHRYCDQCGKEIHEVSCQQRHCHLCGKDLCWDCTNTVDEVNEPDIWHVSYCKPCFDIYRKNKQDLDELDLKISTIWNKMREEANKNRVDFRRE